jgi:hypothetical protein
VRRCVAVCVLCACCVAIARDLSLSQLASRDEKIAAVSASLAALQAAAEDKERCAMRRCVVLCASSVDTLCACSELTAATTASNEASEKLFALQGQVCA